MNSERHIMSTFDKSNFPTSDLPLDADLQGETDRLLDEVLLTLKLERAVIFVKVDSAWRVASAHEVPTEDFWNLAPISLGVLESAVVGGKVVHLVDAGTSDEFGSRDSVIITGIRSVACAPFKDSEGDVRALLYADNRLEKGAFSKADVETLQELAQELGRRLYD